MKVYILIYHGRDREEGDRIVGVFQSRRGAAATMRAWNALPWKDEGEYRGIIRHRRHVLVQGDTDPYWDSVSDMGFIHFGAKRPKVWPPKAPLRIEEWEVSTGPLDVRLAVRP